MQSTECHGSLSVDAKVIMDRGYLLYLSLQKLQDARELKKLIQIVLHLRRQINALFLFNMTEGNVGP